MLRCAALFLVVSAVLVDDPVIGIDLGKGWATLGVLEGDGVFWVQVGL